VCAGEADESITTALHAASTSLAVLLFHIKEMVFYIVEHINAAMQENFSLQKIKFYIVVFIKKVVDLNKKNICLI
jgi:hypothetical protein